MKLISFFSIFFVLLVSHSFAEDKTETYVIDKEHTRVTFEVDHLVISSVSGRFDSFEGSVTLDLKSGSIQKISGAVKADSINTGNEKRDKHLRSEDFFHVSKFPELNFSSDRLSLKQGSSKKIDGKLTLRGVTKTLPFQLNFRGKATDPWGTQKIVVEATTTINRKDFGLTWNEALETGGVMVGEDVRIMVKAEANLKSK